MAARKVQCFGTKFMDKMMTHVPDDLVEKLEGFLVGKALSNQIVNAGGFCSSLIRQNVVDMNDIQLRAWWLKTDDENWTEKAIREACSKRAFGSLVVALQSSGNEGILEETCEWLANPSMETESHTLPTNLDASQAVGTNRVILRKIFEHLSSGKLIDLAVVNKLWKQEATSLLRKRDDICLDTNFNGTCSSGDVKYIATAIMQLVEPMETAPVHGMILEISPHGPPCESPVVVPIQDQVLATLSLKSLTVHLSGNWMDHQSCPPFKFARGLLQDLNGSLANLELKITTGREEFIQLLQHASFPSLKVLRLEEHGDYTADEAYKSYMRALLSLAPNLQELHFRGHMNLNQNFLGESQREVLVHPRLAHVPFIADSLMGSLRPKKLSFLPCSYADGHYFQRFMRTLPILLGTCCSTLEWLIVDPLIALSLMSHGVVLENLSRVQLYMNYEILERLEPRILESFRKFDFKHIFPKLTTVIASPMRPLPFQPLPDHVEQLIEGVAHLNARPNRPAIITLQLLNGLSDRTLDFYFELFPHVQELKVVDYSRPQENAAPMPIESIWKLPWINFKTLRIQARMEMFAGEDLDSIFCGIFPEETAELREKTDEYLKRVNIVPVKPSFTRLKNLSSFTLEYSDNVDVEPACSLSKVTGLIAFARLPKLAVKISTKRPDVYEALQHMKPFASVVLEKATPVAIAT